MQCYTMANNMIEKIPYEFSNRNIRKMGKTHEKLLLGHVGSDEPLLPSKGTSTPEEVPL